MDRLTLYKVAKMYYLDNMGQQEIANALEISRPQISRILKEAREQDIVEINVHMPVEISTKELGHQLENKLGLKRAVVVSANDFPEDDVDKRLEIMAIFAADYLTDLIKQSLKIGIGWGKTIYTTISKMQYQTGKSKQRFLPLVGIVGLLEPYYQTNSIVDRVAEKFKGDKKFINAPGFVVNPLVRQYLKDASGLGSMSNFWQGIDLAFFSVGGIFEQAISIKQAIGDENMVSRLQAMNPIGDVLGNFFDINGKNCLPVSEAICVSIPYEQLKIVPTRVCVAFGEEKVESLKIAAKLQWFNELVTDNYTAQRIIESFSVNDEM